MQKLTKIPGLIDRHLVTATEKRLRVAAYCRVSTRQKEQDGSIEEQEQYYAQVISRNTNWTNVGVFSERVSGLRTKDRSEFQALTKFRRRGVELFHLLCHDLLQLPIVQPSKKTVISPVRRQRFHDVKAAIMGNEPVVVQVIHQVGDFRKALTLHDNERTNHSFFRKAPPPGYRSGQCKAQMCEQLVVEYNGALGCEQRYILNDLLSVDSGQPLSG